MCKKNTQLILALTCISVVLGSCSIPSITQRKANRMLPAQYRNVDSADSTNSASLRWREYFTDPYLIALIDTALKHNQELNITLQEIEMSRNEIRAKKGDYLPFVGIKGGLGMEKAGRYTNIGAMEATTDIKPGKEMPEPVPDLQLAAYATWEVDIWHKLRNARQAAVLRYLSTIEGKNFMVTNLVAEIADSYYELIALDNQLRLIQSNIDLQNNALSIVKVQKQAARVTELAVRKFEAEVLRTKSLQYGIIQRITETENRVNFLVGRYPQAVRRSGLAFETLIPQSVRAGIPSQLLANRPDIRQAELEMAAARLDVKVARARFFPSLGISAAAGLRAFNPAHFVLMPESILYSLAGDMVAPLVNRNEIKAVYANANAKQIQAVYNYERAILNASIEVINQLSKISNLEKSYELKSRQVEALSQSIDISTNLFKSARADYMEVLMTQRDALEAKFELIETRQLQMSAVVDVYQALGGGWN